MLNRGTTAAGRLRYSDVESGANVFWALGMNSILMMAKFRPVKRFSEALCRSYCIRVRETTPVV